MSDKQQPYDGQLSRLGLDTNTAGGLGLLRGPGGSSQLLDPTGQPLRQNLTLGQPTLSTFQQQLAKVGPIERTVLENIGRSLPFPFRDVVALFFHVGQNVQDVINIATRAANLRQGAGYLAELIKQSAPKPLDEAQVGQPMEDQALDLAVKLSEAGNVHIDFSRPVQFLVLAEEGAMQVAADILEALIDKVAPDVRGADDPPVIDLLRALVGAAKSDQDSLDAGGD